jgi:hypothetical protein
VFHFAVFPNRVKTSTALTNLAAVRGTSGLRACGKVRAFSAVTINSGEYHVQHTY